MPEEPTRPDLAVMAQRVANAVSARDVDAAVSFYAPDAVFDLSPVGMGLFKGRGAIRGFFEEWWTTYEDYEFVLEENRDLGGGVSFSVYSQRGRLPDSTAWVELRYASVAIWVRGLVEQITNYTDIDEARAAAERLAVELA